MSGGMRLAVCLMLAGSLCMILIGGIFFSRKDILRKE